MSRAEVGGRVPSSRVATRIVESSYGSAEFFDRTRSTHRIERLELQEAPDDDTLVEACAIAPGSNFAETCQLSIPHFFNNPGLFRPDILCPPFHVF